jgi:hypothetical protein
VFSGVKTEKYCLFNISLVSSTSRPSDLRGATPELVFFGVPDIIPEFFLFLDSFY